MVRIEVRNINLKSFKIEHFAMLFLAIGIIILYVLSLSSKPEFISDYSDLENYEGKIVVTEGIVIDYDETSRGETMVTVLEPDDLESTLKVFIESCDHNFSIGDKIQVTGSVLKLNDGFYELIVINDKDIQKTGHWHHYRLSIPELAHRLEHNPNEFKYLPVEIFGYLKYEPRQPITKLRLSEDPNNGMYEVSVEVANGYQLGCSLHKGDLVSLNVSLEYNENKFEYKLILKNLTLLQEFGEWSIDLSELMAAPFVYEGACVNISGFINYYESHFNYVLLYDTPSTERWSANSSIWMDISNINGTEINLQNDYFITIKGSLYYDPPVLRLRY